MEGSIMALIDLSCYIDSTIESDKLLSDMDDEDIVNEVIGRWDFIKRDIVESLTREELNDLLNIITNYRLTSHESSSNE